jgi:outer membrane protein TolC
MIRSCKYAHILRAGCGPSFVALGAWLLLSGAVAAQDLAPATTKPDLSLPATTGLPLRVTFPLIPGVNATSAVSTANGPGVQAFNGGAFSTPSTPNAGDAAAGLRLITLEQAQQMALGASNPLVRLGQLQVEIAKQNRLGVQGLYFPNIGSQVENLHFNKNTGPVLALDRLGVTIPVDLIGKNQTAFNVAAVQPITPLFAIYQLVKIARADENIARAKAGMPVAETASNVEKNYFDLLVAQRELTSAEADAKKIQSKWLTASNSGAPMVSAEHDAEMLGAEKAVVLSSSKVKELTESLNEMLALPGGTALELVPPEPLVEDLSLKEVTEKATAGNPEVVEAEQTAVKAHAGSTISKLEYLPSVAIVGGYTNQTALKVILPNDFSYIGLVGTFTVFDGFKREHGVKGAKAQAEAADLGVELTKAKVAGAVKSSYLDLDRSRQLAQLARRMVTATQVVEASYHADNSDNAEVESARAKMEADMFRAELEYREAYAKLKSLMGHN